MGLFDKFKRKKHEDEQDEALQQQTEAEQQDIAADADIPTEQGEDAAQPSAQAEAEAIAEDEAKSEAAEPEIEMAAEDNSTEQAEGEQEENSPETAEESETAEQAEAESAEDNSPETAEQSETAEQAEDEQQENSPKRAGLFEKLKSGLKKTKDGFLGKLELLVNSFTKIDEDFFEELEETLILSDIGAETSCDICDRLRAEVKRTGTTDPAEVKQLLKGIISEMLTGENELKLDTSPAVIMVIGVNGAGKTTTIGKLAANLKAQGKRVIVAAADTFRAAAIDQLNVWTDRAGVEIVKHSEGSDPAAVVFDAISAAKARGADVVLCDTAGRLHNKKNLMEELKKIARVINRELPEASIETLLVLDATTGQNAVNQAKLFSETAEITGIALTKLDGTAKGGIIIPIKNELGIPVKLVGVGEKIDDLQPFVPADYVNALFE